MTSEMTGEEMAGSLNGYDDLAIAKKFGEPSAALYESDPMQAVRSLAFVHFRRQEMKDDEAYDAAMRLTMKDLMEFFAEDDEPMPDEPVTESGKDGSASA